MDAAFWHQKWGNNEIGFHRSDANPLLVSHFPKLSIPQGSRVFLPLCGKTRDIAWLLSQGFAVVGAELSRLAIEQLFEDLKIEPTVREEAKFTHFRGPDLNIYVGDFFDLEAATLGQVDCVYDRAALVALPPSLRDSYTRHLSQITHHAPQLAISYEYDQSLMQGPPFSVPASEVHDHYGEAFQITLLESLEIPGGLKGKCPATEKVWQLESRK